MYLRKSRLALVLTGVCGSLFMGMGLSYRNALAQPSPQITFPPVPNGCIALKEVTTGQTAIRKQIVRGNDNTDFAVPTGQAFASYKAVMIPENTASYTVAVNLKYNDGSSSKVFSRKVNMNRMQPQTLPFVSPIAKQPYQINLDVSGPRNNVYHIAVQACSK